MSKKKKSITVTKASEYSGLWKDFLNAFKVYPQLTQKLGSFIGQFDQAIINEIALWKVARYANIPQKVLIELGDLRKLQPNKHEKAEGVLTHLLALKGVRLPVASTFLRFANPQVFQIFDRHIYRAIYGELYKNLSKKPEHCLPRYFRFLVDLRELCGKLKIEFKDSDRILFEFDKGVNPPLNSAKE